MSHRAYQPSSTYVNDRCTSPIKVRPAGVAAGPERLQKYLARCGIASRRGAERLILEGRVQVNGSVVSTLGAKVDPARDLVQVDGKVVRPVERMYYLALNKPPGYVTTVVDPYNRPTVMDLVPFPVRVYPVGRLDADSEGLLLLTNDGYLAHQLIHPRYGVDKEYYVQVSGEITREKLQKLRLGVQLEDGVTAPARVRVLRRDGMTGWLSVTIREGRKRQVRRMMAAVGLNVLRLVRVRIGPVRLGRLAPGKFRALTPAEVARLQGEVE